ncbi:alpha-ketoglutarate-dependent dioxygenase AlkB family protein [Aliidiomarina sp. Khilg15.8]
MDRINIDSYKLPAPDALLYHVPDWLGGALATEYFEQLSKELAWSQDQIQVFGRWHPIPRLQAWHGEHDLAYKYSGKEMRAKPWTPTLADLKHKLECLGLNFNSVLGNWYRDGNDKMGWHSDNEKELGPQPVIASLSFGGVRDFVFRHRHTREKISLPLEHGSLLIMAGHTQDFWQHSLPARKRVKSPRINLTFRQIRG